MELLLHELRQTGSGGSFGLGEEGCSVQQQGVQRGPLGTVRLLVDGRAIRRPARLPRDGLHALLAKLRPRTVSDRAKRRNRPAARLPLRAYLRVLNFR